MAIFSTSKGSIELTERFLKRDRVRVDNRKLSRWEYRIIANGLVEVCMAFYDASSLSSLLDLAEAYLSLLLNLVSVVLLSLTVLTYCLFSELRNLPGCNLLCLALSTLVSQVIVAMHGFGSVPRWKKICLFISRGIFSNRSNCKSDILSLK